MPRADYIWAILRIGMGWIFLWPFLDKTFAFGFATEAGKGWLDGASPAMGFLKFGSTGPFAGFYQGLAGNAVVDWLYMIGLLGVGIAFILGIALRFAAVSGALMMILIYTAVLPLKNNPFFDDHLVYALVLLGLAAANAGNTLGLGNWWGRMKPVQKFKFLA
jgi:thiosulfate dehydrogenase (quinone) large subunit